MPEPVQTLTAAMAEAQAALAAYLEPGGPDCAQTIARLLAVLDHQEVVEAMITLSRQQGPKGLRLVHTGGASVGEPEKR